MPSDLACLSKTWSRPSKLILLTNVRVFSLFANLIQQSRWPLDFKLQRYRWMKYLLSDNPVFRCFKQSPLSKYSIPSPCSNSCARFFYFQNDKNLIHRFCPFCNARFPHFRCEEVTNWCLVPPTRFSPLVKEKTHHCQKPCSSLYVFCRPERNFPPRQHNQKVFRHHPDVSLALSVSPPSPHPGRALSKS